MVDSINIKLVMNKKISPKIIETVPDNIQQSHYQTLQLQITPQILQKSQKKVQKTEYQSESFKVCHEDESQPLSTEQLITQNGRLKQQLLISQQKSQKLEKQLQIKREQITYLTIKSFDMAKLYLESQKKIEEGGDEDSISMGSRTHTESIYKSQSETDIATLLQKVNKYKNRAQKLKQHKIILANNLQKAKLTIQNLSNQLQMEQHKKKKK